METRHHTMTGRRTRRSPLLMKSIQAAIFSGTLLLAAGAFASQNPAGSQAQPQTPGAMQQQQPGQSTPNLPSSGTSSAQPGQQTQPDTSQSQQSAASAGRPSIDDQVKILSDQLNLTSDQQTKVKGIMEDQHTQAMTIVQDNSLAREDKIQKIHALRESTISKVRGTLNDDQKQKFDQMVQGTGPGAHSQDQQPSSTSPQPK